MGPMGMRSWTEYMYFMYNSYRMAIQETMNTSNARERLAEILNRVAFAKDRVRITRRGREIAAVVPIEDLELLERLEDRIDLREAEKALAEANTEGTLPLEALREELGL
jgi:prevent-host-death family protein